MPSHEIGRIRPGHERGTPGWFQRDSRNQYRASLRNRDQLANRPSGSATSARVPPSTSIRPRCSSASLNPLDGGVTTLIPGFLAADPLRTIPRWTEQGRGSVIPVKFIADDRAQLRGHIFLAPQTLPGRRAVTREW